MSLWGLGESIEYPGEWLRDIFGRGICKRFAGQWDTLTSWGWDEAYNKAFYEFAKTHRYDDPDYQYSSNSFMRKMPYKEFELLKEEKSKDIYENILPQWWETFLECVTKHMQYMGTGRWNLQFKINKKYEDMGNFSANNAEELFSNCFPNGEPLNPKKNMYFVYDARRYFGNKYASGLVISRWYEVPEDHPNRKLMRISRDEEDLILVQPTL